MKNDCIDAISDIRIDIKDTRPIDLSDDFELFVANLTVAIENWAGFTIIDDEIVDNLYDTDGIECIEYADSDGDIHKVEIHINISPYPDWTKLKYSPVFSKEDNVMEIDINGQKSYNFMDANNCIFKYMDKCGK